ncbi:MAG TPA: dihydrolipoamide acetyltransferase family protein [Nitrospira sp.]|nr:dihydrolipoamide acetyltransferase family protein [Nitrospira sp.]
MRVELPFLAEGVEGGDVVQVMVKEGDRVTEGQSLIELETEKATVPVPTPAAGTITRLLVRQGDHLKVGQALVELDGEGESQQAKDPAEKKPTAAKAPEKKSSPEQAAPAAQPSPGAQAAHAKTVEQHEKPPGQSSAPSAAAAPHNAETSTEPAHAAPVESSSSFKAVESGAGIAAAPSVRRLARELGVDLGHVKGSEAGGRITAEDVKAFVRERSRRTGAPGKNGDKGGNVFSTVYGNERREAIPSLRRKIAATVTQAWTNIPHVHQFQEADITELLALHKRYAPQFKDKGATLTLTSLFLKAVMHALKLYPQFNATLDLTNGEVIYKEYYNIGVAVETPDGLIVPVIHHVDQKDLLQISIELADLAERTRTRKVTLEELRGATFTVSNMGGIGAGPFMPIVYPPQVAILGCGKGVRKPVYRDGQLEPRMMLPLCVAYDHRLIDGADGARFTNEIVKVLEDFQAMFLGL